MFAVPRELISINIDELYKLRVVERWTYRKLAKHFNVSDTTLINRCKDNGFHDFKVAKKKKDWLLKPKISRKKVIKKTASQQLAELYEML